MDISNISCICFYFSYSKFNEHRALCRLHTIFRVVMCCCCCVLNFGGLNDNLTSIVAGSLDLHYLGRLSILLDHLHCPIAYFQLKIMESWLKFLSDHGFGSFFRNRNVVHCTWHILVWTNWQICPWICAVARADWIGAVATIWPAALIIWALCSCPLVIIICCGWCVVVVTSDCCVCGCCCCIVTFACWTWLWMSFCKLWRVKWISCRMPGSALITWCCCCCCCAWWISICVNGSSTTTVMPLIYWRNSLSDVSIRFLNAWQRLTWCTHWMQILSGQPSVFSN